MKKASVTVGYTKTGNYLLKVAQAAEEGLPVAEHAIRYFWQKAFILGYPSDRAYYAERWTNAGLTLKEKENA